MKRVVGLAVAASLAVGVNVSAATRAFKPAVAKKIGSSVRMLDGEQKQPVLVVLKERADLSGADKLATKAEKGQYVYDALTKVARESQKDLVSMLTTRGTQFQRFYVINMVAVEGASVEMIEQIAARADVAKVIGNPSLRMLKPLPQIFSLDAVQTIGDNIASTGATRVWQELKAKGKGIVVAGQDTGVQWDHPALKSHYRGYNYKDGTVNHDYAWHDSIHTRKEGVTAANPCGYNTTAPCDDDKHGTHTMGTMVGDDGVGNQIGMAPEAQWMACRNMDQGVGTPARYIECFEYFLAPYLHGTDPLKDGKPGMAPDVINNSWGCPENEGCEGDEIYPALQSVSKAGIMIVASAGNDGSGCSTIQDAPAHHSDVVLSVGAHNHRDGKIAYFSSRGPSKFDGAIGPHVTAPGVSIRSSIPGSEYEGGFWSGTSMAGPHVAGAVALLWSANPALIGKVEETKAIFMSTADAKTTTESCGGVSGSSVPNNTFGHGAFNAYKAVTKAMGR